MSNMSRLNNQEYQTDTNEPLITETINEKLKLLMQRKSNSKLAKPFRLAESSKKYNRNANSNKNAGVKQSRSLPSLKLNKYLNSLNSSLTGLQIVKFNLSNLNYKRTQKEKQKCLKKSRKRKFSRLNSIDQTSLTSTSRSCSSESDEDNFHANRSNPMKNLLKYKSNTSTYKTSASSLKSNSINRHTVKFNAKKKRLSLKAQDEEGDSSIHSGRSLSETELLGNAVKKKFSQIIFFKLFLYDLINECI